MLDEFFSPPRLGLSSLGIEPRSFSLIVEVGVVFAVSILVCQAMGYRLYRPVVSQVWRLWVQQFVQNLYRRLIRTIITGKGVAQQFELTDFMNVLYHLSVRHTEIKHIKK